MPRPKGAGRDPRVGGVSSRVLDQILDDYDSGQRARLVKRIRRLQDKAYRLAVAEHGCEAYGPTGAISTPPALVAAQIAGQLAASEEIISRIREREVKVDGMAAALFEALNPHAEDEERRQPVQVIVKYAHGVEQDGDPTQQAAEPGASGDDATE